MDISPAQVTGGALAAVTAAVLGGQLGVAGTVGGAALTSVVITVGGAVYQRSLETTRKKANAAAAKAALGRAGRRPLVEPPVAGTPPDEPTHRVLPAPGPAATDLHWPGGERVIDDPATGADRTRRIVGDGPTRRLSWEGTRYVPSGHGGDQRIPATALPEEDSATAPEDPARRSRIRWSVVAATSGLAFLLCMLVVTGFEGVTGRPLSGGEHGTTVGHLFRPGVPGSGPVEPAGGSVDGEPAPENTGTTPPSEPSVAPLRQDAPRPGEEPSQQAPEPGVELSQEPGAGTSEQQPSQEEVPEQQAPQDEVQAPRDETPEQQPPETQQDPGGGQPLRGPDTSTP